MTTTIAYDVVQKRPGCAIIQTVFGATVLPEDLMRLDNWLTSPTDDMKVYDVTPEQFEQLVVVTNSAA